MFLISFFSVTRVRSFTVQADSISEDVIGEISPDYSIYCDVKVWILQHIV